MKYILIFAIVFYKRIFAPIVKQINGAAVVCRFSPSCSEYALESINKHGAIRGLKLSLKRFISCRP